MIIGKERALVFDIGYGYEDIRPLIRELTDKPLQLVVSHGDPDHSLGASWYDEVGIHPLDFGKMHANDADDLKKRAVSYRIGKRPDLTDEIDLAAFLNRHLNHVVPKFLRHGDRIELGGTDLEVVHVPGHSYGHIMLLDAARRRLFSGDAVTEHNVWYFLPADEQAPFSLAVSALRNLLKRAPEIREIYPAHDVFPLGVEAIAEQIECLEEDLPKTYQDDVPFHSFMGDGYQHRYKSVELIYSDERLAEWLGHDIDRSADLKT
nr:MBL fold metallo-hydrolase [Collinsella urealyticum]